MFFLFQMKSNHAPLWILLPSFCVTKKEQLRSSSFIQS
ncbi:hypothetical protein SMIDD26_01409 [Streptococcus mitis]|uniref:Uncharacterized protein n=1 Tax=Streptococcus mitis TaxID=28037 RepID=A0A139PP16_STRMT|nr:hypothetical protein SMIDD26_01409 [Streptococcus mitis]